jgi:ribonuclease T1
MRSGRTSVRTAVLAVVALVAALVLVTWTVDHDGGTDTLGGGDPTVSGSLGTLDPDSGLAWVPEAELPAEAQSTLALIDRGGPFTYPGKDGSVFGNFEGLLPDHARGYYHEYTVVTPGSQDRGARRIITGGVGEYYWTADHYASFQRIGRRP